MVKKVLTPDEIIKSFKSEFGKDIIDAHIKKILIGPKKNEQQQIWLKINKAIIHPFTKHLMTLEKYPHFAVSSGYDLDKHIEIVYHFSIYYGSKGKELSINATVPIPKSDPTIESICDLIPGALIAEGEKQEMLGIKVLNIPVDKRVFVSDDFPEDAYPWRKDDKGPDSMVRNLHEVKKK